MSSPFSRRNFLRGGFFQDTGDRCQVSRDQDSPAAIPRGGIPMFRPPGATDEATFLDWCTQCDACIDACPHGTLFQASARFRNASGTPTFDPTRQPCWMCIDTPCASACTPGVLQPSNSVVMGTARIDEQTCMAYQGTFCSVCLERCPVEGAVAIRDGRPSIVEDACTGCGVCHYVCPAPQNAVLVMPIRDRPSQQSDDTCGGPFE